jgi:xanthine dehydrogenase YagS FAD-binding subunit
MLPNFVYSRPTSVEEATEQAASGGVIHAGGTDLLGCLRDGVLTTDKLVSIQGLQQLRGISMSDGHLRIGALTTLTEIADHPVISKTYTALAQGAAAAASPQLRNQGTIGGNICQRPRCWYFRGDFHCLRKGGDTCYAVGGENEFHCILGGAGCYIVHPSDTAPALVALEAQARIVGPKGRRVVPLGSFFVLPEQDVTKETVLQRGEIVTDILLPALPERTRSSYRKVRARGAWDFALAGVALALRMSDDGRVEWARVVLSGVAPVPWHARDAEKALTGQKLDERTIKLAAEESVKGSEPLSQNAYKVDLVQGVLEEALLAFT